MTSRVTKAPRQPGMHVVPPTNEDGEHFDWGMRLPGGYCYAWGNTVPDLVSVLAGVVDYCSLTDQEQLVRRIKCALRLQVIAQAHINAEAMKVGTWLDWRDPRGVVQLM